MLEVLGPKILGGTIGLEVILVRGHCVPFRVKVLPVGNLVRGLPSKFFENDHTCVACQKGKQHKASCKSKLVTSISQPLQILHMDLFGPTFVKSLMGKMYCLVITNDYSRFSWVFFLAKKDETSGILRNFITGIENQLNHRVKIIRSDNGTEFKNQDLNQFCNSKGIKREYNNARTPQQNGVAERKNRTLIEAARTMLADSLLPIPFWAEAVNTACYVHNRVLVTKPHNKTPYELLIGRPPIISFMRPFGCPVTILNTLDHLGKFDGKADEGVLVVSAGNRANANACIETNSEAGQAEKEKEDVSSPHDDVAGKKINQDPTIEEDHTLKDDVDDMLHQEKMATKHSDDARSQFEEECDAQLCKGMRTRTSSTNSFNTVRTPLNTASASRTDDPLMSELEDTAEIHSTGIFGSAYDDFPNTPIDDQSVGAEADFHNMEPSINVGTFHKLEPKKVNQALDDVSWVEAMQEELLQFKLLNVWTLVDLPKGKKAIVLLEEGIDYDEVFAPVARIEAIRLFLAYASYMDFTVYQMDVKSAFLYGTIEEEVYVNQPPGFEDPEFPNKVYKVEKALYGLHQAPRAWYETLSTYLLENRFRRASTPMETHKSLSSNAAEPDVDVHLYRSMIGTLMYLTSSRPDIMFAVCACSRFQVTPKDSPMDLIAYLDSDYAGASIDRKSTTGEAEYIAASYCCGQVLWLQNQLLDYGYNFMRTKIHIDNESTISKLIEMVKIHTDNNVADLLTKASDVTRFEFLIASIDKYNSIQLFLNKQQRLLLPHTRTYLTPILTSKLFSNMRRASKGYSGVVTPLFEKMLVQAQDQEQQQSPLRITSSPSLSPQPTLLSPSPDPIQPTHEVDETASMPHDSPLHAVHSHGSAEGSVQQHDLMVLVTKLNDRIDGLEKDLMQTKKTYSTALTKLALRVKKLESKLKSGKARINAKIVLSDDEEIAEDSSKQGRKISQINEDPTVSLVQDEVLIQEETPTEIIKEHGSGEKGEMEISTANIQVSTASQPLEYSGVATPFFEIQDEGISWIPQEEEVHEKPSDETEVIVQEETPTEIIKEHGSGEKGEMEISTASPPKVTKVSTAEAHVYTRRSAKDKGKAIMKEPATPKKVKKGTQVQLSMDEELARKMEEEERARFNAEQEARALQEEEEERLNLEAAWELQRQLDERQHVPTEATQSKGIDWNDPRSDVEKGSSKPSKRETSKTVEEEKVKKEDVKHDPVRLKIKLLEQEEKHLQEEEQVTNKYPIVNWEYQMHGQMEMKDMEAYTLTRADGTVRFHGGVHSVFLTDTPMEINMLVETKYPLKKEIFEKMINLKLQAEEESTMAFELIKFTRSQIEEKQ
ncbi:putative ribonuclease H-like domain-containing protein [Tanacetum coccineum]